MPYHLGMKGRARIDVAIVTGPLDAAAAEVDAAGGGGVCSFLGITRPESDHVDGPLIVLRYEAARPLADRLLEALAAEIVARHGLRRLVIRHAVGDVPVGAASVFIAASADHRDAAFAACREAIDRTKREIPIWKQEIRPDARSWSPRSTVLTPITRESGP